MNKESDIFSFNSHNRLRIEVLINSPGPHDEVRIRQPFDTLIQHGIDCRVHEKPFIFNKCIRKHSLVIWQRPLPESRKRMLEHLQWLRERKCLLFIDWDDHPELFPKKILSSLQGMRMAHFQMCHGLITSNCLLADYLRSYNPLTLIFENGVKDVPPINLGKHFQSDNNQIRVFLGNLNRSKEHQKISNSLKSWIIEDQSIKIILIGEENLVKVIPKDQIESYPVLPYWQYRQVLRSCHLALLPLDLSFANNCKTTIKWQECAAESVAVIGGPGLYSRILSKSDGIWANGLDEIVPMAQLLANNKGLRCSQVHHAYASLSRGWKLDDQTSYRIWLLSKIWAKRKRIDLLTKSRVEFLHK